MTPAQRLQLGAAIDTLLDVTTWWIIQTGGTAVESSKRPPIDWESVDDPSIVDIASRALERAAHELDVMARDLSVAVRMGSDYGAAFQSVQADAATEARRARKQSRATRAIALKAQGLSVSKIALRMATEDGRKDDDGTVEAYPTRTVERWLSARNPDRTT